MKELSIEEKAKRYDKAIEIAKEINNEQQAQPFNVMTRVFPELAESEDERMKEAIIATIHLYYGEPLEDEAKEMIAWLEKQGEQKHIPWYDLEKSKEAGYTIVPNEEYDRLTKPAEWSEEDEEILKELTKFIPYHLTAHSYNQYYNWAISHRPQSHWKPNNEQIEALEHSLGDYNIKIFEDRYEILKSLYNELKKLREE